MRLTRQVVDAGRLNKVVAQAADDFSDTLRGRIAGGNLAQDGRLVAGEQQVMDFADDQRRQDRNIARRRQQLHQTAGGIEQARIARAERNGASRPRRIRGIGRHQKLAQQGPVQSQLDTEVRLLRRGVADIGGDGQVNGDDQMLPRTGYIGFVADKKLLTPLDNDAEQRLGDAAAVVVIAGLLDQRQAGDIGMVDTIAATRIGVTGNIGAHSAAQIGNRRVGHYVKQLELPKRRTVILPVPGNRAQGSHLEDQARHIDFQVFRGDVSRDSLRHATFFRTPQCRRWRNRLGSRRA